MRDDRYLIGWGMATAIRHAGRGSTGARARLDSDGSAVVQIGSQDLGTGTFTIMAQAAADGLGVPVEGMRAELGDTDLPSAPGSFGSMTAANVSTAARLAGNALRNKMIRIAVGDNPRTARSQIIGGVVWGIGQALTEATEVFHATGKRIRDLPITPDKLL